MDINVTYRELCGIMGKLSPTMEDIEEGRQLCVDIEHWKNRGGFRPDVADWSEVAETIRYVRRLTY